VPVQSPRPRYCGHLLAVGRTRQELHERAFRWSASRPGFASGEKRAKCRVRSVGGTGRSLPALTGGVRWKHQPGASDTSRNAAVLLGSDLVDWIGQVPSSGEKPPSGERRPPSLRQSSIKVGAETVAKPAPFSAGHRCGDCCEKGRLEQQSRFGTSPSRAAYISSNPDAPSPPLPTRSSLLGTAAEVGAVPAIPTCPRRPPRSQAIARPSSRARNTGGFQPFITLCSFTALPGSVLPSAQASTCVAHARSASAFSRSQPWRW
jgi:hypothetical protein